MCTFSAPAPTLGLGLPPGAPLLVLVFVLSVGVPVALLANYARNAGTLRPLLQRALFRLMAVGYLAILTAQFLTDFVVLPSDAAVQAWASDQYARFGARGCSTSAIATALVQAQDTIATARVAAMMLAAIGLVLIVLGSRTRGSASAPKDE
jgi:hypothetical protein